MMNGQPRGKVVLFSPTAYRSIPGQVSLTRNLPPVVNSSKKKGLVGFVFYFCLLFKIYYYGINLKEEKGWSLIL